MERSFSQKNIDRYRRMLSNPRDEDQRRIIVKLLAEEETALRSTPRRQNKSSHVDSLAIDDPFWLAALVF